MCNQSHFVDTAKAHEMLWRSILLFASALGTSKNYPKKLAKINSGTPIRVPEFVSRLRRVRSGHDTTITVLQTEATSSKLEICETH